MPNYLEGPKMCSDCAFDSGKEYLAEVDAAKQAAAAWRKHYLLLRTKWRELNVALDNTKAELTVVRSNLADTSKTLDKYRGMHVKMSKANSDLRKSVSDLEDTIRTLTEERDLSRELFQGMVSEYADLLDRYTKSCDDYEELASRFIWRMNTGHDKV